ncbi:MAG: NDP-sugar synthase [Acidobacteria bacterium]|nr:NDP-sugar synthase [Acidobacteriota bacterium]
MRAVVLVGGFGTRLRPLTLTTPKPMLPVAGVPMIERIMGHLAEHGIDDVVLSLGFKPDAFMAAYPDDVCAGVHLSYAVEPTPLDTAGGIAFAARAAGISERFVVVNGDILTSVDLSQLMSFHESSGAEGTIFLTPVEDPSHFGVVPTDESGRVLAFVEKPPAGEAPTNLINGGYYVLEPSVIERVPEEARINIERVTFPAMVADQSLFAVELPSYWIDVGTPERYLQANLDAAVDDPSTMVGAGCVIAPDAVVESSVLLAGAVVEAGASVRRSMVGAGAVVSAGSTVDDLTVLGDGVRTEPGSTLSGVRLPDPEQG